MSEKFGWQEKNSRKMSTIYIKFRKHSENMRKKWRKNKFVHENPIIGLYHAEGWVGWYTKTQRAQLSSTWWRRSSESLKWKKKKNRKSSKKLNIFTSDLNDNRNKNLLLTESAFHIVDEDKSFVFSLPSRVGSPLFAVSLRLAFSHPDVGIWMNECWYKILCFSFSIARMIFFCLHAIIVIVLLFLYVRSAAIIIFATVHISPWCRNYLPHLARLSHCFNATRDNFLFLLFSFLRMNFTMMMCKEIDWEKKSGNFENLALFSFARWFQSFCDVPESTRRR